MLSSLPHNRGHLLTLQHKQYKKFVKDFFDWQLQQDGVDITTDFLFGKEKKQATALVIAKESGVLAGREELDFFLQGKERLSVKWHSPEGEAFAKDTVIAELKGDAVTLLQKERVLLNTLSRMSGIATVTGQLAINLPPNVYLAATRKTLWGMLDKKAVHVGGGLTHRLNAADAVLIKENHLQLCHNDVLAVAKKILKLSAEEQKKLGDFWEIEIETNEQFSALLNIFEKQKLSVRGVIMFDNFSPANIAALMSTIHKPSWHERGIFFESSGGITPENMLEFSVSGVDVLSSGFLTHTAQPIDVSMRITNDF